MIQKSMSVILVVVSTFLSLNLWAGEQLLARIERSDNSDVAKLILKTNSVGDAAGMIIEDADGRSFISPADIQGKGKVLVTERGQKVLVMQAGGDFSLYAGGSIVLTYLKKYNLIGSNDYGHYTINLQREGDSWSVEKDSRRFQTMRVDVYTWGIRKIDFR